MSAYPFISANTAIGYEVAEQLSKSISCEIVLIGIGQDEMQKSICDYKGMPIEYLNNAFHERSISKTEARERKIFGEGFFLYPEAKRLREIVNARKIDALICVIAPSQTLAIVSRAKLKIPVILYQLDPFYNNGDVENHSLKKQFIRMAKKCNWIFTTDLLMQRYRIDPAFEKLQEKMSVLQFPKLVPYIHDSGSSDNSERCTIRFLYGGTFYHHIRSHRILLELKRALPENSEILYYGNCDMQQDYEELKNSGVVCKGYVSQDELKKAIDDADVLINIGNTVHNQLGSKLIEYIATGKPIVNVMQFSECPTREVLNRYRYSLSLDVTELNTYRTKVQIDSFIKETSRATIPWVEIKRLYNEYSVEYVAEQIINVIRRYCRS